MKTSVKLSHEARLRQAIKETQDLLNKELAYSKDLQIEGKISFYTGHIAKLELMLIKLQNS